MTVAYNGFHDGSKELAHRRDEFSEEIIVAYRSCSWAELALRRQGWTPERLQKASQKAVNDFVALNVPYLNQDRREELVDYVLEKALVAVLRFRPEHPTSTYKTRGGGHFDSWIYDVMRHRCTDWYRSKAEGNGDRRKGHDNMIELTDDPDPADHDADFSSLVDDRRRSKWQAAAVSVGWELDEWIVITLDQAARQIAA